MARKALTFALLALMVITAHAQHFDWAKSFYGYGDKYRNFPCGLVSDSEGNTYRLMQVARGGWLDTIDPFEVVTNHNPSALLVKMSPDGRYLWHRIINPWEYGGDSGVEVHDLRMLGDTALMMMIDIPLPYTDNGYSTPIVQTKLYYLDTMLTTSETLMATDSIYNWRCTAFITLGLDGTLLEHHFLQVTYLDSLGNPLMGRYGSGVYGECLNAGHFDVDSRGNIYVVRRAEDIVYYDSLLHFQNGGLIGYRFMVDGTRFLTHIPPYSTGRWNQQVLKFSPHFDSLLDASYIVGDAPGADWYFIPWLNINSFDVHNNQLYFTIQAKIDHDGMPIARSNGLQIEVDSIAFYSESGCVLRLDTGLNADLLMQFNFVPRPDELWSGVILNATCVDTATGSLFVLGLAGTDSYIGNGNPHQIVYRGDTLDNRNDAFWLRVGIDDGHFLSYGRIHSSWGSSEGGLGIAARNNRVFAQVAYGGSVFFADTSFSLGASQTGLALAQWDYDGHEVAIYPFQCTHSDSQAGHLLLTDTVVYVTGNSFSSTTNFGGIACGMGQYIAKLVDTSMRSPYVYPDLHANQSIVWPGGNILRISNPGSNSSLSLNATATSGLPVVYTISDPSMAMFLNNNGVIEILATCQQGTCQVTASQPGTSYWNPASRTKTLIIGNAPPPNGIEEAIPPEVHVYPNPTYGKVTVTSSESLVTAFLTDLTGRREEMRLVPSGLEQYLLDLTSRPHATYLLTLTSADGKQHTVRLLKQGNTFNL